MSASVPPTTPTLHPSNILGSPGTTVIGLYASLQVIGPILASQPLPTSLAGWVNLVAAIAVAVVGGLSK
jgi:hypothetical protein